MNSKRTSNVVQESVSKPEKKVEKDVSSQESIPKIIYMCDRTLDSISKYGLNWTKLNPDYKLKLYDNEMCEKFLSDVFGDEYKDLFNYITHGPIKADFWRICILYKYGVVYIDADNEPLVALSEFINPDVDFVTCTAYSPNHSFNPNFIMAKSGDSILKQSINTYLDWYREKKQYSYFSWSIMNVFTQVIKIPDFKKKDGVYEVDGKRIQIIREQEGKEFYDDHNIYKGVRVFNNRYRNYDAGIHQFIE
jgi:hypothetical protein